MTVLEALIGRLAAGPSRTGSLVITIYGDAVAPRGGSLWVGTLQEILKRLGIEAGAVRTALSRLAADDWLERTRIGRNSFYRLTAKGRAAFETPTRRIYFATPQHWDGTFRLVLLDTGDERNAQRAALEETGFGPIAPGVMLGLPAPGDGIAGMLAMEARSDPATSRRLAARAWPIEEIAERYRRFLEVFGPVESALDRGLAPDGLDTLAVRILLIHEYRRVMLRDPLLPDGLLPADWPGHRARRICARVYRALVPASEAWLDRTALAETGALPPPDARFHERFRGWGQEGPGENTAAG